MKLSKIFFILGNLMNLFVAILIIGALLSMTQFQVNIVNAYGAFTETELQFNATLVINNGGYYEIENGLVVLSISNATHYLLTSTNQSLGTIPLGLSSLDIQLSIPLSELFRSETYILNDSVIYMSLAISGEYALSLMSFQIEKEDTQNWDAPLDGLMLNYSVLSYNSTHKEIRIDYSFNSPPYAYGLNTTAIALKGPTQVGFNRTEQLVPHNIAFSDTISIYVDETGTLTVQVIFNSVIFEISFEREVTV